MDDSARIKIVIADDHQDLRTKIRALLERCPELFVTGEAVNGLEAVQKVRELHPDVLLLDIHMPIMDGIEVLEILRKAHDRVHVIILSAFGNKYFLNEITAKGANGYMMKEDAPTLLVEAIINCIHHDKIFVSPKVYL
jgi:two-component system, NarL family, nitrate/nitrite response regulator NarL